MEKITIGDVAIYPTERDLPAWKKSKPAVVFSVALRRPGTKGGDGFKYLYGVYHKEDGIQRLQVFSKLLSLVHEHFDMGYTECDMPV